MQVVFIAAVIGLLLSVAIERMLHPAPNWRRHCAAWSLHFGLWLLVYSALVMILGRPWFAMATVTSFLLLLVQVNNAKMKSLREPFVFHDFDYFTDAIRHPRLYIPFLGWGKFIIVSIGFVLAVAIALNGEKLPINRFLWNVQSGAILTIFLVGMLLVAIGNRYLPALHIQPKADVIEFGFLTSLWGYGVASKRLPQNLTQPFAGFVAKPLVQNLPHLVAVQSESFFDPRPLFTGIRSKVLSAFDQIKDLSLMHGKLKVPAWGANTVRTEFSFLTGIEESSLGVHRFNPYRALASGWHVASIATYLKSIGYRTVCIHPYPASFYLRNRVYPQLGFDVFLDISEFQGAERCGPYISDIEVAKKIATLLDDANEPLFIYAITMENHGPLHLEQVSDEDVSNFYVSPPPEGCDDLTVYLRHLKNADAMIDMLIKAMSDCDRDAGLCWFGDHVPIMPTVYNTFGTPDGDVEYVIWHNGPSRSLDNLPTTSSLLPFHFLKSMHLL